MRLRHRTCLVISYPTSADGAAPEVQNKEAQKGQKRECSGRKCYVIENGEEDLAAGDKFHSQSYCIVRNADFETFDRVTGYTDTGIAQHRHNTGAGPRDFEEQPKYEGRTFVARFRVNITLDKRKSICRLRSTCLKRTKTVHKGPELSDPDFMAL
ncbi:hypothetical protein B0H14DRAFT_2616921 [Mycena olivaceomarginata]|nr:hypothetical protein B0H14DRAFT_2616921 [Mycena olivaceomarginata]